MDGAFPTQPGGWPGPAGGRGDGPGAGFGGRGRGRGFRGTDANAKTKMCNRWLAGDCRFGDRCNFAHGDTELRKLPDRDPAGSPGRGYGNGAGRGWGGYGRGGPGGRFGGRGYGAYGGYGAYPDQAQQGYPAAGAPGGAAGMTEDAWAQQAYGVPGPNGWFRYVDKTSGDPYYFNRITNVTQWEQPAEWVNGPPQM